MSTLFSLSIFFLVFLITSLEAVSAPPFLFEVQQPDGSKISVRLFGSEYYNWMETGDGYVIKYVEDDLRHGWFYSNLDENGKFVASDILVTYPAPYNLGIPKYLREISPKVRTLNYQSSNTDNFQHSYLQRGIVDSTLQPLVLLVEFDDAVHTYSAAHFSHLLFAEHLSPNHPNFPPGHDHYPMSVREYFDEISNGKQKIIGDLDSVADWEIANHAYSYYVDDANGTGAGDHGALRSAASLIVEIAMKIDEEGFDFTQLDNGKGAIDVVILIVAGKGGDMESNFFWPHMFVVPTAGNGLEDIDPNAPANSSGYFSPGSNGGVAIRKYIVIQEKYAWDHSGAFMGNIHPIGTICHELGHVLGLPDLYDTREIDEKGQGIGEWGLMGSGNWQIQTSPAYMSAWSRYRMGYIDPMIVENVTSTNLTIYPPAEEHVGQTSYILPMNSHMPQEYLILENRQKIGTDTELVASGLLVWHIDETITDMYPTLNAVNVNPAFYGVNLLQADGDGDLYSSSGSADAGDPYPYGNTNVISGNTNPNTATYDYDRDADGDINMGTDTGIELEDITETNGLITLKVTNPNMQGHVFGYDEGNFEGIAFPEVPDELEWVGIRIDSDVWETHGLNDSVLLAGIQIVFSPSFSTLAQVTDYKINIWKGWAVNKPEILLYSHIGTVEWSPNEDRDGGWAFISLIDKEIIWIEDDYYVEIQYEGHGYFYFFDPGIFSDNTANGMSYFRANSNEACKLLTNVPSVENGDWNIRVVLSGEEDLEILAMETDIVPQKHKVHSNYPNPFNPRTKIPIYLASPADVSYIVFDVQGRHIARSDLPYLTSGYHEFNLNMNHMSSGVYFYQFIINDKNQSPRKMVYLK